MVILVIETENKNNEYELIKRNPSKNRVTYRVDEYVHQNNGITCSKFNEKETETISV